MIGDAVAIIAVDTPQRDRRTHDILGQVAGQALVAGRDIPCYVNLQEKKKTLPLSGASHRLQYFPLCTEPSMRTSHQ